MKYFTYRDKKELKDYLYYGHGHDAIIEKIEYIFKDEYAKERLSIFTINNYDKVKEKYVISGLVSFFSIKNDAMEDNDSVLCITVEDDLYGIKDRYIGQVSDIEKCLYLVIQMRSLSELHIICKEVYISEESV